MKKYIVLDYAAAPQSSNTAIATLERINDMEILLTENRLKLHHQKMLVNNDKFSINFARMELTFKSSGKIHFIKEAADC